MMSQNNPQYPLVGNSQFSTYSPDNQYENMNVINNFSNMNIHSNETYKNEKKYGTEYSQLATSYPSNMSPHMPPNMSQQNFSQAPLNFSPNTSVQPTGYPGTSKQNYGNASFPSSSVNANTRTSVSNMNKGMNPNMNSEFYGYQSQNTGLYQPTPQQMQSQTMMPNVPPIQPTSMSSSSGSMPPQLYPRYPNSATQGQSFNQDCMSNTVQPPKDNFIAGNNTNDIHSNVNSGFYDYQSQNTNTYQQIPQKMQSINTPVPPQVGARYMNSPPQTQSLNPEYMPSAVQVIELDKSNNISSYPTGSRDRVPPLVTTDFVATDQGTCNPKFIRSSLYVVPNTPDMLKSISMPFVLNISPFAKLNASEQHIVCGEFSEKGPIRCIRCKAYMSPLMTFIDGGRRFQCNICGGNTEVSEEYFTHLDQNGRRIDCFNRPELCLGSYELLATKEYCRNDTLPKPPAFIFMLDVSYSSVKSNLVALFCKNLVDNILPYLASDPLVPDSPKPLVGFITYDRVLHFYNLKSSTPQMHVVSYLDNDTGSDLVPIVNGFLVDASEAVDKISILMDIILKTFEENEERNVILGPAIEAGMEALKAAGGCSGKLFIFHSTLPTIDAPGKMKARDDRTVLGTDKEKNLFSSGSSYYSKLAESCVESGVSVDLFLTPSAFIDVATLSELPKLTGGNLYKYDYFSYVNHSTKFLHDIQYAVSAPCAFDAIMRVRTSLGTRTVDFLGNFWMKNTEDVQLACMDSDKSVIVEIKHNDKLQENESVNIQVAVLYTSLSGQRRLRIHNISFNVSSSILDIFKLTDLDTLMNWMCRNAVKTFQTKSVKDVRDEISQKSAQILASYRRNYAEQSKPAELVLPENLKLLPLYANSLVKCDFMQSDNYRVTDQSRDPGTDLATDERAYQCFLLNGMDVKQSQVFLYPRLLPLTNIDPETKSLPKAIRASYANLSGTGVYLIENGIIMMLWIGQNVDSEWFQNVFNCSSAAEITNRNSLPLLNTDLSRAVNEAVQAIRSSRSRYMMLNIVVQGDRMESAFRKFLVEDRGERGNSSYVDFLCYIHKEIRTILNY